MYPFPVMYLSYHTQELLNFLGRIFQINHLRFLIYSVRQRVSPWKFHELVEVHMVSIARKWQKICNLCDKMEPGSKNSTKKDQLL